MKVKIRSRSPLPKALAHEQIEVPDSTREFFEWLTKHEAGRFELLAPGAFNPEQTNLTDLWMLYFQNDYD